MPFPPRPRPPPNGSADTTIDAPAGGKTGAADDVEAAAEKDGSFWGAVQRSRAWQAATAGVNYDVHKVV